MKSYLVSVDGKNVKVWAQKIAGVLWYHYKGETRSFQPKSAYVSSSQSALNSTPGKISSPMPGKIMKVHASEGMVVAEGDVVVLMEAMKMEYSLEADITGRIKKILCKEADQVTLGQVLIEIDSEVENGKS